MPGPTKRQIIAYMWQIVEECRDSYTQQVDFLELAEWAAGDLDCEDLLEFGDSPFWQWAIQVANEANERKDKHGL